MKEQHDVQLPVAFAEATVAVQDRVVQPTAVDLRLQRLASMDTRQCVECHRVLHPPLLLFLSPLQSLLSILLLPWVTSAN